MAIRVFMAPNEGREIIQKAIARLLVSRALASKEDLLVILWHWTAYSRGETGDDQALGLRQAWRDLAKQIEKGGGNGNREGCRILVLLPELPSKASGTFAFPDLLIKSILQDQAAGEPETIAPILWSTYNSLKDQLDPFVEEGNKTGTFPSPFILLPGGTFADSMMVRFCYCMAALPREISELCPRQVPAEGKGKVEPIGKGSLVSHDDLFKFFEDPSGYRANELHGAGSREAAADQGLTQKERIWARKVSALEHLLSRVFVPQKMHMNILMVENDFPSLMRWDDLSQKQHDALWKGNHNLQRVSSCFRYIENCTIYVVHNKLDFQRLRSASERELLRAKIYHPRVDDGKTIETLPFAKIPWDDLDLVLQDVMLDKSGGAPTGLSYTPYYLEASPQALVFVLTGMDVESLAMAGDIDWKYVDAVVSKRKLGSLWWHYHQAFCRVFGRMFWSDFSNVSLKEESFGGRRSLRQLFGSLRRWQIEPAILAHGQGVAEMIDHAHRHIPMLWRLADDVVGTLIENRKLKDSIFKIENRMLFAMGIWLHDIGHRGNEFTDDSSEVRLFHSSISEYLLLRNPGAYGAEWLPKYCHRDACRDASSRVETVAKKPHLEFRNCVGSCKKNEKPGVLCPLRQVGLLCRYHQSNAPLHAASLDGMCSKGKFPSPYTRYRDDGNCSSSQDELDQWLDKSTPLSGWRGSEIRLLSDFVVDENGSGKAFMAWAGLLRMLDGLQISRSRVGSPASLASFLEYLDIRSEWCRLECLRLDDMLGRMRPGSKEYQDLIGRRFNLERYDRLLRVQYVHWWRQLAVHGVRVLWHWHADEGDENISNLTPTIDIQFELDDAGLDKLRELVAFADLPDAGGTITRIGLRDVLLSEYKNLMSRKYPVYGSSLINELTTLANGDVAPDYLWAAHVAREMVWSEHKSQLGTTGNKDKAGYLDVLPVGVNFRVSVKGRTSNAFPKPLVILECPSS